MLRFRPPLRPGTDGCRVGRSRQVAAESAGLDERKGLTTLAVRHSFATHFLEGGGSVTDLMTQLGHSKLETTQIYAASVSERRRATVMEFEAPQEADPRPIASVAAAS